MKRAEAITRLREHEAELRRLGVQHLYLFGSTACDEARDGADVDLFFDYEKGKFRPFRIDGREGCRDQNSWPEDRHHDA